ncbi:MAG: hypothetical protein KBD63_01750 [Bacteriovoracaceae bacterium]|nr:hypothetical protein [Bacteriovoracaceae bacterium]
MRRWMIRTKKNQILGPISKVRLLELYHNGSLKTEDEVCSGNGFWFFIREQDLVSKYLLNHEEQNFDPLAEMKEEKSATQVIDLHQLNLKEKALEEAKEESEGPRFPQNEDLEYPVLNSKIEKKTVKSSISIPLEIETPKIRKKEVPFLSDNQKTATLFSQQRKKDDSYLNWILLLLVLLALTVLVYRKRVIHHFFDKVKSPDATTVGAEK